MPSPRRCVVDTNVPVTANDPDTAAGPCCRLACVEALEDLMKRGHLFIDEAGEIVEEYAGNLRRAGEPGIGDAFLKWVLDHEWGGKRITRVPITPAEDGYQELPPPPAGTFYDRSDRKFLAVSAAHQEHPPILQAFDSKWWGWREALEEVGVIVHFLCPEEIAAKHAEKMGG